MRAPTRELAAKAFGLAIFATVGLIRLNIMGLDLSALALLGGAVGVGLGFGLQMIASNFVSGIIILVEGQATLGDLLELDGGGAGDYQAGLRESEVPDVQLRPFGDRSVQFGVEFWVEWTDDGSNKYTAGVRFLILNALNEANIETPFPQCETWHRKGCSPAQVICIAFWSIDRT